MKKIGIVNDNKIIICRNNVDCIEENIEKIIVVDKINGKVPDNDDIDGVFDVHEVEGTVMNLYEVETFKYLLENNIIGHNYLDCSKSWLLSHLIQYKKSLPDKLLTFIYEDYSGYNIIGWLGLASNLDIAKWLYNHGASLKEVNGYGIAKQWWEIHENRDLIDYFYND